MRREPVDSAKDARDAAERNDLQASLVALADAVQGIAEYQRYIRNDQLKIKEAMNIS